MRVNIYSQELTKEIELVEKTSDTGIAYFGVRMVLASSQMLHHSAMDDDRSAVTFWIPSAGAFSPADLAGVFRQMAALVESVQVRAF